MNVLRKVFGVLLIIAGIGAIGYGVYFDIVHFFVGGIVEVVDGVKANPTSGGEIGWGIFRVCISGVGAVAGIIVAVVLGSLGLVLIGMKSRRNRRSLLRR